MSALPPQAIRYLAVALLLGLGCAHGASLPSGKTEAAHRLSNQSWQVVYDRQAEHFKELLAALQPGLDPDSELIEAQELVSVAEEFYLLAEYETAMEILQQAVLLLEERSSGEQTRP